MCVIFLQFWRYVLSRIAATYRSFLCGWKVGGDFVAKTSPWKLFVVVGMCHLTIYIVGSCRLLCSLAHRSGEILLLCVFVYVFVCVGIPEANFAGVLLVMRRAATEHCCDTIGFHRIRCVARSALLQCRNPDQGAVFECWVSRTETGGLLKYCFMYIITTWFLCVTLWISLWVSHYHIMYYVEIKILDGEVLVSTTLYWLSVNNYRRIDYLFIYF